jgi:hypothetical protein
MRVSKTYVTLPELSRANIRPDEIVTVGRGPTPLFRRDRLPEILSRVQSLLTTNESK